MPLSCSKPPQWLKVAADIKPHPRHPGRRRG